MGLGTTLAAWLRGLQFQGAGTWEMRAEPWRYDPSVQARWLASADSHRHSAEHGSVIFLHVTPGLRRVVREEFKPQMTKAGFRAQIGEVAQTDPS